MSELHDAINDKLSILVRRKAWRRGFIVGSVFTWIVCFLCYVFRIYWKVVPV